MELLAFIFHLTYGLVGLVIFVLDLVAIVGLLLGTASTTHKVLWIVLILMFPFVGVLLYYLIGRSPRDA
jgi:hypothetical protein